MLFFLFVGSLGCKTECSQNIHSMWLSLVILKKLMILLWIIINSFELLLVIIVILKGFCLLRFLSISSSNFGEFDILSWMRATLMAWIGVCLLLLTSNPWTVTYPKMRFSVIEGINLQQVLPDVFQIQVGNDLKCFFIAYLL